MSSERKAAGPALPPVLAEAQAAGVDLAHLRYNLSLTPAQRLARLQAGIRMFRTLRTARRLPALPGLTLRALKRLDEEAPS